MVQDRGISGIFLVLVFGVRVLLKMILIITSSISTPSDRIRLFTSNEVKRLALKHSACHLGR